MVELIAGIARQGFEFQACFNNLWFELDLGAQIRIRLGKYAQLKAGQPLDHQPDRAIRGAEHAMDDGQLCQFYKIAGFGCLEIRV